MHFFKKSAKVRPTMYAVIQTGGKQYRVQAGDFLQIEKKEGEAGSVCTFDQVLFIGKPEGDGSQILVGQPTVAGARVEAQIVAQGRGDKILIIKMKRRKQYRRTQGHRQEYTQVLITALESSLGGRLELSEDQKKARLASFQSHLTPWGGRPVRKKATPSIPSKQVSEGAQPAAV